MSRVSGLTGIVRLAVTATTTLFLAGAFLSPATAVEEEVVVTGRVYTFASDSHYAFSVAGEGEAYTLGADPLGSMTLTGNAQENAALAEGMQAFLVEDGQLSLSYETPDVVFSAPETAWHLVDDKTKKVNGEDLASNVMSGALIVQSSFDGETWYTDTVLTDVLESGEALANPFYTTKAIQLENGCYYRVLLAYKMQIKVGETSVAFVDVPENEAKKVVEVYRFYAVSEQALQSNVATPDDMPRTEVQAPRVNAGSDTGYSESNSLSKDDPHYGWNLGHFVINGYTRDTIDRDTQVPVYLKNVGDRVTLWFVLDPTCADLRALNGNPDLSICADVNGYDRHFEIAQTDFGRGTLIIRFTDREGVAHEPVVYTDFLAANVHTGADTRVQLFEEGDYEVSLNYEIKHPGAVPMTWSYSNYKITFKFAVRNGNCMVFPFDTGTGSELSDGAITANGFMLDMARSKYLEIDVEHAILKETEDGVITKDVRFSRPAKDGESYSAPGIYTFTVKNKYTDDSTTKVIYVGEDARLELLSQKSWTLDDLNAYRIAEAERVAAEEAARVAAEEEAARLAAEQATRVEAEEQPVADAPDSGIEASAEVETGQSNQAPKGDVDAQPVEKNGIAGLIIIVVLVAVVGIAAGMVIMHKGHTPAGAVKRGKGSSADVMSHEDGE